MSAYLCTNEHITYLVSASNSRAISYSSPKPVEELVLIGNMLVQANLDSLASRYDDSTENLDPITAADFRKPWVHFNPVQVLKSAQCYEYQSCEHDGWETSEARKWIDSLKSRAIGILPGYDAAKWGAPER
jgi:hypothetical protein